MYPGLALSRYSETHREENDFHPGRSFYCAYDLLVQKAFHAMQAAQGGTKSKNRQGKKGAENRSLYCTFPGKGGMKPAKQTYD